MLKNCSRILAFSVLATHLCVLSATALGAEGANTPGTTPDTQAASGDRRLSELFYQLQVLQQEVQELRGLVEEQAYQLNRLARDQKEQYIDLDRRVAGLSGGAGGLVPPGPTAGLTGDAATTGSGLAATTPQTGTSPAVVPSPGGTTTSAVVALPGGASGASERDTYQRAFDLMKARRFDESIASFNGLIVDYPNGQYTPNAFYWLGELYLAQQNTEQARQSFMQVVNLYPEHPKVPDTLYKLGVAYHRLGDNARAMEYFGQVQSRYPQSSAAGLATSYAKEIQ